MYASERIQERQKNYGQDYDRQRSEECDDVCMIVERVVVKRMVLIGPMDEAVLSTKNSVQVNNYSIYRALNVRAIPFVESQCDMLQRHDDRACKRKPIRGHTKRHEAARKCSSASRADFCTDVICGHVMSHRTISFVAPMFFSIVCAVAVTGMRKRSEKGCRRA